jgi:hypothetical protein
MLFISLFHLLVNETGNGAFCWWIQENQYNSKLIYCYLNMGMNELIISGPNEVVLVGQDGSSWLAWLLLVTPTKYWFLWPLGRLRRWGRRQSRGQVGWEGGAAATWEWWPLVPTRADEDDGLAPKGARNMMYGSMAWAWLVDGARITSTIYECFVKDRAVLVLVLWTN